MMMTGSSFDYDKLCQEAQNRWLKPSEILFILLNHESFPVDLETPKKPSSGSLFLFNRRVHRNFRKDGHAWKKKKDGRAVGEAHERLKVGNVDTLSCYYAHGELNPYFQRRSYWMLDPACDHIVLVHYREVSEGRFLPPLVSQPHQEQLISLNESLIDDNVQFQGSTTAVRDIYDSHQSFDCAISGEVNSNYFGTNLDAGCLKLVNISENYDLSLHTELNKALRELEEQLSLDKCDNNVSDDLFPANSNDFMKLENPALRELEEQLSLDKCDNNMSDDLLPANSNDFVKLENPALRELEEQLSLDKCDNNISDDLFPANSNDFVKLENPAFLDNERGSSLKKLHENLIPVLECSGYDQGFNGKQKSQTLVSFHGIFRKNSPSWIEILEHSSSSTRISADVRDSASLAFASVSEPSYYTSNATGTQDLCGNVLKFKNDFQQISDEKNKFSAPFDWLEQFSLTHPGEHQQQQNLRQPGNTGENAEPKTRRSDLSSQFSAGTTGIGPNSTMASAQKESSIDRMGSLELPNEKFSNSSGLFGLWFDQGQHGVSLATESSLTMAKKQLFRIHEISPEWSFSFEKTKVFIIGDFLCYPSLNAWAVMFGDTEVPAEIVRPGVLYCQSPEHATGKVAICITSRNRESCSEVREFEFRTKHVYSSMEIVQHLNPNKKSEELLLLVKFVHLLLCQHDFVASKRTSQREVEYDWKMNATEEQWLRIIDQLQGGCEPSGAIDWIVQELVKDKFQQWILHKIRSTEDRSFLLSRKEQGIIHLISGLGYEWALTPILDNGVGINFRDANGWTALHWAARFGREKMAAALLAAGALAGAVTDPTPHDPMGKTAGAIASACGHKGLAGYLSEADLTSHLSSLAMKEYEISKGSATVVAEKAVENISERTVHLHGGDGAQGDLSLQDSLAAVRNAAQAAARIQAAFRAHSFRKRREQTVRIHDNEYGITFDKMYSRISLSKNHRAAHIYRDQKFDKAALSIQKQYRGWKGRKDFLTLRQHVVKIQAHVRGHQVRKKYSDFLRTVGVLEKLVLRWRRRGVGLRGFCPEPILDDEEDIIKVFRKQKVDVALDQAYKRVLSMVESPTARQQYRRMLEIFQEAKAEQGSSEEEMSKPRDDA